MADPMEPLLGNTEATPGNTKSIAPEIESKEPVIPCAGTELVTKPGTPKETTLDIPISTIPGTQYPSYTPRNMNMHSPILDIGYPKYILTGSSRSSSMRTASVSGS